MEIAEEHRQSPLDACCDLLSSEHCGVTMIDFMACEEDIARILQSPLSSLISDATYPTEGKPHPRVYGSCTHLLTHFVQELGVLSLPEAVHKLTGAPAQALRLKGKGIIAPGMDADICIFDPAALKENATYTDPCRCSDGMDYVLVNGEIALEKNAVTGVHAGRAITR